MFKRGKKVYGLRKVNIILGEIPSPANHENRVKGDY